MVFWRTDRDRNSDFKSYMYILPTKPPGTLPLTIFIHSYLILLTEKKERAIEKSCPRTQYQHILWAVLFDTLTTKPPQGGL